MNNISLSKIPLGTRQVPNEHFLQASCIARNDHKRTGNKPFQRTPNPFIQSMALFHKHMKAHGNDTEDANGMVCLSRR